MRTGSSSVIKVPAVRNRAKNFSGVTMVSVNFAKIEVFQRRPVAHGCTQLLELPNSYRNALGHMILYNLTKIADEESITKDKLKFDREIGYLAVVIKENIQTLDRIQLKTKENAIDVIIIDIRKHEKIWAAAFYVCAVVNV